MMTSCAIIRTLSGVWFLIKETKNEENAVTNMTENPIVSATETLIVTAKAEQIPRIATVI